MHSVRIVQPGLTPLQELPHVALVRPGLTIQARARRVVKRVRPGPTTQLPDRARPAGRVL